MDSENGDKKTIFMAQDPDFSMEDIDDLVFYDDGFPSLPDFPCLSSPSPDLNPSFAQSDSLVPAEFDVDEEIELDFWDPSLALQSSCLQQQQQQQAGIEQNIGILDHEDLAKVFLDWLKNNRESISAADLRSIKLKRSTIESASRRLGRAQLLKLILSWVQNHHLQKKAAPFSSKPDLSANPVPIYNWCLQNPVLSPPHQMPSRMASANREARKRRMARHRKFCSEQRSRAGQQSLQEQSLEADDPFYANNNSFLPADSSSSSFRVPQLQEENRLLKLEEKRRGPIKTEKNLRFLLQKVLKQSDVGSLGRIVLPKKEAESHLPELDSRDGICIEMEDIGTSMVWNMRYRFWPNNKSRMYLLENTGDFVRSNELQEGDFIVIYFDVKCGKYMIRGVKVRQPLDAKYGKAHQKKKGSSFDDKKHKPPFMRINSSE